MPYQNCVQIEDQTIFGLRVFGVKVQYTCNHIVLSAQILLKDYYFYIVHPILFKLSIYHHWTNALRKRVRIRNSTPGGLGRGT